MGLELYNVILTFVEADKTFVLEIVAISNQSSQS